uniref:contactin-associated protein-like 2 n=1 Tax=Styela clava TaxID=7725 RepID=UPI00193A791C|nr:contactin-associated protein-like 2 [Styela clava]
MEKSMVIILLIICHIAITTVVAQHSVPFPSKGEDSCNVVQVNCGSAAPVNDESASQHLRHPGPPGKRGPKGDLGPIGRAGPQGIKGAKGIIGGVGPAGDKGSRGSKGQQGIKGVKGDAPDYMRIQNMMSATSCKDLNETYGVSTSGYYPLRTIGTGGLVSVYCDFRVYDGIHTCHQLKERNGITTSGNYFLGPANNQYEVHCDFSGSDAITEIRHDSMGEVLMPKCEDPGCYSKIPLYTISLIDTIKIIENSRECRQYIQARCEGMMILRDGPYAWWVSRDGEKMLYWGGATSRRNSYCACGEAGGCADSNYKCNCDKNDDGTIRADEGFLTDKTKLPVKEIRFGDMGDSGENGWHTLGKLECMG